MHGKGLKGASTGRAWDGRRRHDPGDDTEAREGGCVGASAWVGDEDTDIGGWEAGRSRPCVGIGCRRGLASRLQAECVGGLAMKEFDEQPGGMITHNS